MQALARLAEEIRGRFHSYDQIRLGKELDNCQYLHAVVNETLRMSPSLPGVISREGLPGGISVVGETVPAGVDISIAVCAMHHNEDVYDNPHRFIPERWLSAYVGEDMAKRSLEGLTPFSYGSRQCIGKRLAVMELHLTLARAVWKYDLEHVTGGKEDRYANDPDIIEYKMLDHLAAGRSGPVIRFWRRKHED